jgi:hypothetical protein
MLRHTRVIGVHSVYWHMWCLCGALCSVQVGVLSGAGICLLGGLARGSLLVGLGRIAGPDLDGRVCLE